MIIKKRKEVQEWLQRCLTAKVDWADSGGSKNVSFLSFNVSVKFFVGEQKYGNSTYKSYKNKEF